MQGYLKQTLIYTWSVCLYKHTHIMIHCTYTHTKSQQYTSNRTMYLHKSINPLRCTIGMNPPAFSEAEASFQPTLQSNYTDFMSRLYRSYIRNLSGLGTCTLMILNAPEPSKHGNGRQLKKNGERVGDHDEI